MPGFVVGAMGDGCVVCGYGGLEGRYWCAVCEVAVYYDVVNSLGVGKSVMIKWCSAGITIIVLYSYNYHRPPECHSVSLPLPPLLVQDDPPHFCPGPGLGSHWPLAALRTIKSLHPVWPASWGSLKLYFKIVKLNLQLQILTEIILPADFITFSNEGQTFRIELLRKCFQFYPG